MSTFHRERQYQLTENRLQEWGGVFSPDEKWLAYTSEKDMEGSFAIYLNRFPEMNRGDSDFNRRRGGAQVAAGRVGGVYYRNGSYVVEGGAWIWRGSRRSESRNCFSRGTM